METLNRIIKISFFLLLYLNLNNIFTSEPKEPNIKTIFDAIDMSLQKEDYSYFEDYINKPRWSNKSVLPLMKNEKDQTALEYALKSLYSLLQYDSKYESKRLIMERIFKSLASLTPTNYLNKMKVNSEPLLIYLVDRNIRYKNANGLISFLLDLKINPDVKNSNSSNILHLISSQYAKGFKGIMLTEENIQRLITPDNINEKNNLWITPIMNALIKQDSVLVDILLRNGARIDIGDKVVWRDIIMKTLSKDMRNILDKYKIDKTRTIKEVLERIEKPQVPTDIQNLCIEYSQEEPITITYT